MGRSRSRSGGRGRRSFSRNHSRSRSCSRSRSISRARGGRPRSRSRGGREFCKDYTRGECNRGNACRFSHDFRPAIPSRPEPGPPPGMGSLGSLDRSGAGGPLATYDRFGREMCGDFKRGDCRRGERCRYSHGDAGARPPPPGPMNAPVMGMPPMMGPMSMPPMGMPPMMGPMGMMGPYMGMPPPMGMPGMGAPTPMHMPPVGLGPPRPAALQGRRSTSSSRSGSRGASRRNGRIAIPPATKKPVPIDINEL